jgi:hypothetical protein
MSTGDTILLVVASYIAVISLIRLMRHRRDEAYRELEAEIRQQQQRQQREEQTAARRARQGKAA